MRIDGIAKHWLEQENETTRAHAHFCSLSDNDQDRWILRGLGVTLGPYPVEHSKNIPMLEEQ